MILVKIHLFFMMLIQQVPPPPNVPNKMGPTPVGDVVPLDENAWVLLVLALALIIYKVLPAIKRSALKIH